MKVNTKKIEGKTNFVTDLSNLLAPGKSNEIIHLSDEYNKLIRDTANELMVYGRDKKVWHLHKVGESIHNFEHKCFERNIELKSLRKNIAEDLNVSQSRLDYFIRFFDIFNTSSLNDAFSWGVYRELLDIKNEKLRNDVTEKLKSGILKTTDDIRKFKKNNQNRK